MEHQSAPGAAPAPAGTERATRTVLPLEKTPRGTKGRGDRGPLRQNMFGQQLTQGRLPQIYATRRRRIGARRSRGGSRRRALSAGEPKGEATRHGATRMERRRKRGPGQALAQRAAGIGREEPGTAGARARRTPTMARTPRTGPRRRSSPQWKGYSTGQLATVGEPRMVAKLAALQFRTALGRPGAGAQTPRAAERVVVTLLLY